MECGGTFTLPKNASKAAWRIAGATFVVLVGLAVLGFRGPFRAMAKAHFWEAERERREADRGIRFPTHPAIPTEHVIADDRVNPP